VCNEQVAASAADVQPHGAIVALSGVPALARLPLPFDVGAYRAPFILAVAQVPLGVEIVTRDVDRQHLAFSDQAFGVEVAVDLAAYLETCFGAGRADELDDDLMTDQRLASSW
jgi:hypothetical protein